MNASLKFVWALIEADPNAAMLKDTCGGTPLHHAFRKHASLEIVRRCSRQIRRPPR